MPRNLQNCYCDYDSAERRARQLETETGRPHGVWADAAGYWVPQPFDTDSGDEIDYAAATDRELDLLATYAKSLEIRHRAHCENRRRGRIIL